MKTLKKLADIEDHNNRNGAGYIVLVSSTEWRGRGRKEKNKSRDWILIGRLMKDWPPGLPIGFISSAKENSERISWISLFSQSSRINQCKFDTLDPSNPATHTYKSFAIQNPHLFLSIDLMRKKRGERRRERSMKSSRTKLHVPVFSYLFTHNVDESQCLRQSYST